VRIFVDQFDDQIGTKAGSALHLDAGNSTAGQTILAVPELRRDQLLIERVLRSAATGKSQRPASDVNLSAFSNPWRHRHFRAPRSALPLSVPASSGPAYGHRVIDTGVGVNDHAPRRLGQRGRKTKGYEQNDAHAAQHRFIGRSFLEMVN